MRIAATIVLVTIWASPVRAEVAALGGLALGQEVKKTSMTKTTVYGCAGRLYPSTDRKHKVTEVRFEADSCKDVAAVVAAISKEFGGSPIANDEGDRLWEGKRASVILSASLGRGPSTPVLILLPPGPGSKRTCWKDDGFAAFWATFEKALASRKPAAMAGSFRFPLKNSEGQVKFKDAAAFTSRWKELIDEADAAEIASGELTPSCRLDLDHYTLRLPESYGELTATRARGSWRWSSLTEMSPD